MRRDTAPASGSWWARWWHRLSDAPPPPADPLLDPPPPPEVPRPAPLVVASVSIPQDPFATLREHLRAQDISADVADRLTGDARCVLAGRPSPGQREVWLAAARALVDALPVGGGFKVRRDRCTVVAVLGPTGVGKSTTLAKLAAISALKDKRTVAFITTDTYRVAAPEQLKVYGRLLKVPVVVAHGAEELEAAITRHQHRDLVLVDTAGHGPNDDRRLGDLEALLTSGCIDRRLLAVSATTKVGDLRETVRTFGRLLPDGLLFTKLDESRTHGGIVDLALWSGLPLTYFTVGQGVPQDIEVAQAARVVSLVLPLPEAARREP